MTDSYKKIVNLQSRQKTTKEKSSYARSPQTEKSPTRTKSRLEDIDQVYSEASARDGLKKELGQIDRPIVRNKSGDLYKNLSLVFFGVILIMLAYYFVIDKKNLERAKNEAANPVEQIEAWYSVQLTSKETYFGLIKDVSSDPVILEKVYYNYNQIAGEDEVKDGDKAPANIRLVKRGKESHGPDGTMDIVRSQILFMEPLSSESKILKAILEYEK